MLRRVPRQLALFSLVSFALLVGAELVARWAEPGPMTLVDETPYERSSTLPHTQREGARVSWDGSYYEINARGWRGPQYEPQFGPEEFRVVALGDSCTFGKGVDEPDCWPRQLERDLQARLGPTRRVMVANLGVNGYSGKDYLEVFLTQALAVRPQLVVIGYNVNDFPNVVKKVDAAVFQGGSNLRSSVPYDMRAQLSKLALFRAARAFYYEANRTSDLERVERFAATLVEEQTTAPEILDAEKERIGRIAQECAKLDARLALFMFPYESQVYLDNAKRGPVDATRAVAQACGVPFVEMLDPFRQRGRAANQERLFIAGDRYHPNAEGYRIVAAELVAAFERLGWIGAGR